MPIGVQGDLWQMGVALPVDNRSFNEGKFRKTTLASAAAKAATSLVVTVLTEPAAHIDWLRQGDVITLGPSTSTTNPGATETVVLTADPTYNSTTLAVQGIAGSGGLINAYSSGDPVSGIGTAGAENWILLAGTERSLSTDGGGHFEGMFGAASSSYDGTRAGADDDYFGQTWTHQYGTTSVKGSSTLCQVLKGYRFPMWGGNIRMGCYYKYVPNSSPSGPSLDLILKIGTASGSTTSYTLNLTSGASAVSSWTRTEGVVDATALFNILDYVRIEQKITAGSESVTAAIDHVYAEHAIGVGQTDAGYITFADYPVAGSFGMNQRSAKSKTVSLDNRMTYHSVADSQGIHKKWEVEAEFAVVGQTMWNQLQDLLRWQAQGHSLTLHTFIDDLPWVMVGYMTLGKVKRSRLDLHYFSYQFREA